MNILEQMWQGNSVAWFAFSMIIVTVGLFTMLLIIWWKMPEPAKKLFWNNLFGGHRPIVANAYDNKVVRFETPHIFREGVMYDKKGGWSFVPRLTKDADDTLNTLEKEIVTRAFHIEGAPGQFYHAYSGKGTVVNPELLAVIENARANKTTEEKSKLQQVIGKINGENGFNDETVLVDRNVWINILQTMKDKYVRIEPLHITHLSDPRNIKNYLPKAYSKSQLLAQEEEIKASVREEYGGNNIKIILIVTVISLVATIVGVAKQFGLF